MVKQHDDSFPGCPHNPSPKATVMGRTVDYFLNMANLYDSYSNTAVCSACGTRLNVPAAFTHPLLKLGYFLAAFVLFSVCLYGSRFMPNPKLGVVLALLIVPLCLWGLVRLSAALVLAAAPWPVGTDDGALLARYKNAPSKHKLHKFAAIMLGINIALWANIYGSLWIVIVIVAATCCVSAAVYKKVAIALSSGGCLCCGGVMLWNAWAGRVELLPAVSFAVQFALLCVVAWFYFYLLDCRKDRGKRQAAG